RPGEALLPPAFFLLVAIVFAFALGPEPALLARAALAVLWVGALLASLLPVAGLFAADAADGTLDQYAVRGIAAETVALARMLAQWLVLGLPLLLALPIAGALLATPPALLLATAPRFAAGTLGLAAVATAAGALMVGARGGGGLAALLAVPLALPVLVFGAGAAGEGEAAGADRLLLAAALLLAALAPLAAGAALRLARG
ncbi:MAG: heme exporter protein CcmB, partial [Thermaurantiacus tibetensis]